MLSTLCGAARRVAVPIAELSDDAAQLLIDGTVRFAMPFVEIGGDSLQTSHDVFVELDRRLHGLFGDQPLAITSSSQSAVQETQQEDTLQEKCATSSAMLTVCLVSLSPALMPAVAPVMGSALGPVMICAPGIWTMKSLYFTVSGMMALAAWTAFKSWPENEERGVQQKTALAVLTSSSMHFVMAGFGIPAIVAGNFVNGELMLHYCAELLISPLFILNVRQISETDHQIALTLVSNMASHGLMILALATSVPWSSRMVCFAGSALCLAVSSWELATVPYRAAVVTGQPGSLEDRRRCQRLTDLLVSSWGVCAFLEASFLLEVAGPSTVAKGLLVMDFLTKMATCNVSVKLLGPHYAERNLVYDDLHPSQATRATTRRHNRRSVLVMPTHGIHGLTSGSDTESSVDVVRAEYAARDRIQRL